MLRATLEWRQQNNVGERPGTCDRLVAGAQAVAAGQIVCAHLRGPVIVMPRLGLLLNDFT
jgi:hypothetical protein